MRSTLPCVRVLLLFGAVGVAVGCPATNTANETNVSTDDGDVSDAGDVGDLEGGADATLPPDTTSPSGVCSACVSDTDCAAGASCAQIAGDTFCVPKCSTTIACTAGANCILAANYAGDQVSVCAPTTGACAVAPPDAATPAPDSSTTCGTLVAPTATASCKGCLPTDTCQANGCYGGWWCDTASGKCHAAPATCGPAPDAATPPPIDAGPPPTGSVNAAGGKVSRLFFAVVGDTRPPLEDDTASYPTAIITSIYKHVAALSTPAQFVVSTGDYMFARPSKGEGAKQLDLYLTARAAYSGTLFPALGNHECTGADVSNCGPSGVDGITASYTSFLTKMLAPIGQTKPYFSIRIDAIDGKWTSKFVFVAANAWDSAQSTWFDTTLATPTTYTFIVRHEPAAATTAPGVTPSEAIMAKHPYTMIIAGHTHLYTRHYPREVVFGNGGAPLTGTSSYGFGTITQRADGVLVIDAHDYATGAVDTGFSFALNADGTPAK